MGQTINLSKIELTPKQIEVAKSVLYGFQKYTVVNSSRQAGKSELAIQLMIFYAMKNPKKRIAYISPNHNLNRKVFKKVTDIIDTTNVCIEANKTSMEIVLKNKTVIIFRSAALYDNIRGETLDFVICDEFAYTKEAVFNSIIRPTTAARKGSKVLLLSTPRGKNLFYQLALKGKDPNDTNYAYHLMMYSDNPYYDLTEIEDARKSMPEAIFKAEYLAEFTDGGTVFKNISNCQTVDRWSYVEGELYSAGLDFGRSDATVLTIIDSKGNVAFKLSLKSDSWASIIGKVADTLNKYNPYTLVEANEGTINSPLFEQLSYLYSDIHTFQTNNSSKNDLIETLQIAFEKCEIGLPTNDLDEAMIFELGIFGMKYSKATRKVLYSAPEGHNDDNVISLGLAYKAYKTNVTERVFETYLDEKNDRF